MKPFDEQAYAARIEAVRDLMGGEKSDALLVTSPKNVTYLSRFRGSFGYLLLVGSERPLLFTDSRYVTGAEAESVGCEVRVVEGAEVFKSAAAALKGRRLRALDFESEHISHFNWLKLCGSLKIKARGAQGWVERVRRLKTDQEVDRIAAAVRIAESGFRHVLPKLKPGVKELDIALELEFYFRSNGAEGAAFDIIVASGPRSAMPHAGASARAIRAGDPVVIDFGCMVDGYNSDITRTVFLGRPSDEMKKVYRTVYRAQSAALDMIESGVGFSALDRAARDLIKKAGYGKRFGHALGHGVGIEVHEQPRVWSGSEAKVEPGMVFTVEPGIYLPGAGGVRIEDMVAVTDRGPRRLSRLKRTMTVI